MNLNTAKNIIAALLIFTVIVVIHELGHFLLAKKNGIGVIEFSVGMGPRLVTLVKTEKGIQIRFLVSGEVFDKTPEWKNRTKYSWKLLPLGGSCIMVGEDELVEREDAFGKKGVWARISVIFAGPFFNFILAFIISLVVVGAKGIDTPKVIFVQEDRPGEEAGIQEGDEIVSIGGKSIIIGRDVDAYQQFDLMDKEVEVVLNRDGEEKKLTLNPVYETYLFGFSYEKKESEAVLTAVTQDMPFAQAGMKAGDVITGVNGETISSGSELNEYMQREKLDGREFTFTYERDGEEDTLSIAPVEYTGRTLGFYAGKYEKTNVLGGIRYSFTEVRYWITTTVRSVAQLVTGKISTKELAGPVGIVDMVGEVIEESEEIEKNQKEGISPVVLNILYMMMLLSANLGVMNLLPIPALDGGRLVFLLIEAVRGKPIDPEKEGIVHLVGFALLMILMVYVMYNDIVRIFTR